MEHRQRAKFQANAAAFHLRVFATKPWLSGATYFALQDYAAYPGYSGGDPWPDPPFDQKGLIDLYGSPKPAFATVQDIYKATMPIGPGPVSARQRNGSARASRSL